MPETEPGSQPTSTPDRTQLHASVHLEYSSQMYVLSVLEVTPCSVPGLWDIICVMILCHLFTRRNAAQFASRLLLLLKGLITMRTSTSCRGAPTTTPAGKILAGKTSLCPLFLGLELLALRLSPSLTDLIFSKTNLHLEHLRARSMWHQYWCAGPKLACAEEANNPDGT